VAGVTVNRALRFVEKPDETRAKAYIQDGDHLWNSGIFTWRCDVVLKELASHCPWLTEALLPLARHWGTPQFDQALAAVYEPLKRISIDYALMEKATDIKVVTATFDWDDVGSWDALYDHLPADHNRVITRGQVLAHDCRDALLVNETKQMLVGVGLARLSVVVTEDAILIVPKGRGQHVKQVVDALKAKGRSDLH
jgi:mannose-1-phosphate guanylyltransferase